MLLPTRNREVHFLGRIHRGRVVHPSHDLPYLDMEALQSDGLGDLYRRKFSEWENGNAAAIWDEPGLMLYSFSVTP